MKFRRIPAIAVAAALVTSSALLVAGPASASTVVGEATFYGAADFGVESGGYPAGVDWFFGEVTGVEGPHAFGPLGLSVNDGSGTDGNVQILSQTFGELPTDAVGLAEDVSNSRVFSAGSAWTFQLPLFSEGATGLTTLRPSGPGTTDTTINWITSGAIAPTATYPLGFAAGAEAPFSDLAAAIFEGTAPTFLGYGLFFGPSDHETILGVNFNENHSVFSTVIPTRTITPNPISAADFADPAKGLTLTGTGWLPGSDMYIEIQDPDGHPVFQDNSAATADASGNIAFTVVAPTAGVNGTYSIYFDDDSAYYGLRVFPRLAFEVADPAPTLAATGVDTTGAAIGGVAFLLLGGVLAIVAVRRRTLQA